MILGGAMIIGFSAFKGAEAYAGKKLDPVTIYFHGSTSSSSDVQNQSLWTETPNDEDCGSGNNAACAMEADASDLTGPWFSFFKSEQDYTECECSWFAIHSVKKYGGK